MSKWCFLCSTFSKILNLSICWPIFMSCFIVIRIHKFLKNNYNALLSMAKHYYCFNSVIASWVAPSILGLVNIIHKWALRNLTIADWCLLPTRQINGFHGGCWVAFPAGTSSFIVCCMVCYRILPTGWHIIGCCVGRVQIWWVFLISSCKTNFPDWSCTCSQMATNAHEVFYSDTMTAQLVGYKLNAEVRNMSFGEHRRLTCNILNWQWQL